MIKIIIVDDHAILAEGLTAILQQQDLEVVQKFTSGHFALAYLKQGQADIMITDYSMPDMDGLTLVRAVKALVPAIKIIVLSMHDEADMVRDILNAGIDGYVLKKYAHQELVNAIMLVNNGRQYWSPEINRSLLNAIKQQDKQAVTITERELDVLNLLVQQMTSRQIAAKLFIGERTVETHRKNLMRKTGVNNVVGLVKYAYDNKLV